MDMDGMIAIALPAWTFYVVVLLNTALVVIEGWRLVLQLKERRETNVRLVLQAKARMMERMGRELGGRAGGRPAMPPELPVT